jgi:hypothetical protein
VSCQDDDATKSASAAGHSGWQIDCRHGLKFGRLLH